MKAMLLAAGRGRRMGELTQTCPKPLLTVKGKSLIEYHLSALGHMGIDTVVINLSYQIDKVKTQLGDGSRFGVKIRYSIEDQNYETGGGIINALPLLGDEPFLVINSDIWTDCPFNLLQLPPDSLLHVVLADNPYHHPEGDFSLAEMRLGLGIPRYTFTGIGLYHPTLFKDYPLEPRRLADVIRDAIEKGVATGEHYDGQWINVDTPERLAKVNAL